MEPVDRITAEHLEQYLDTTRRAFGKLQEAMPARSFLSSLAKSYLDMARSYFDDACHNAGQGERVLAFAQVNYAHAWLDAGARLGLWDVGEDDQLFTLFE